MFASVFNVSFLRLCSAPGQAHPGQTGSERTTTIQRSPVAPPPHVHVSDGNNEMPAGSRDTTQGFGLSLEDPSDVENIDIDRQLDIIRQFYLDANNQPNDNDNHRTSKFIECVLKNMILKMLMRVNIFSNNNTIINKYTTRINKIEEILGRIGSNDSTNSLLNSAKTFIKEELLKQLLKQFNDPNIRDKNTVRIPRKELPEEYAISGEPLNEDDPKYVLCTQMYPNGKHGDNWLVYDPETARKLLIGGFEPHSRQPITGFKRVVITSGTKKSL